MTAAYFLIRPEKAMLTMKGATDKAIQTGMKDSLHGKIILLVLKHIGTHRHNVGHFNYQKFNKVKINKIFANNLNKNR